MTDFFNQQLADCAVTMNGYGKRQEPFFFVLDFLAAEPVICPVKDLEQQNIRFCFPGQTAPETISEPQVPIIKAIPAARDLYGRAFDIVKQHIHFGNSFLVNLTCATPISLNISLKSVFETASAPYKIYFKDKWVCFSPECFVKIREGDIYSYPMKGTIDAQMQGAEKIILEDEKELAEHYTIVDLIRNDLSAIAENVTVEKFRYINRITTNHKDLLQVSSAIKGKLPANYTEQIGTIICSMLPAGSVTGAPKRKTVEIICEAETYSRGFYTGIAGYFDGRNVDSCVLIRFIEDTGNGIVYKSGGGITRFSDLDKEYNEMLDKIYVPVN